MQRPMMTIYKAIAFLLIAPLLGAVGFAQAGAASAPKVQNWHALGSSPCAWWMPLKDANGQFDISRSVNALRSDGFQCSVFVIEKSSAVNSFANFKKLLDATRDTNIAMWAVIVPPAEGGDITPPYRGDYVAWARALAELSLKYKNFRGFNIDDYINAGINGKTFTKSYGCKIYATKEKINPNFLFVPTIYDLDPKVANRLAGCVDGVMLWFVNLESDGGLKTILEDSRYVVDGRFPIYGGVYAHSTSWHKEGNPSPAVFRRTLETTCKYADGAVAWQLSLEPGNPLLAVMKTFLPGGSSPYAGKCGVGNSAVAPH